MFVSFTGEFGMGGVVCKLRRDALTNDDASVGLGEVEMSVK